MATTNMWYTHALLNALKGKIDLENFTVKAMLCTNSYIPVKNGHEYRSNVTNEVEATGYVEGGLELTNKSLTLLNNIITFDADDPEWVIVGSMTCRYVVYYIDSGDIETDLLIGCVDLGENVTTTDNIFRPVWNEAGISQIIN